VLPCSAGDRRAHRHGTRGRPTRNIDPAHVADRPARLYYDTALAGSRNSLLPTLEVTGADHILFGTDWPAAPEVTVEHNIANLTGFDGFTDQSCRRRRDNASRCSPRFADRYPIMSSGNGCSGRGAHTICLAREHAMRPQLWCSVRADAGTQRSNPFGTTSKGAVGRDRSHSRQPDPIGRLETAWAAASLLHSSESVYAWRCQAFDTSTGNRAKLLQQDAGGLPFPSRHRVWLSGVAAVTTHAPLLWYQRITRCVPASARQSTHQLKSHGMLAREAYCMRSTTREQPLRLT